MSETIIKLENVSMSFNMATDKITSLKKYFIKNLKHFKI